MYLSLARDITKCPFISQGIVYVNSPICHKNGNNIKKIKLFSGVLIQIEFHVKSLHIDCFISPHILTLELHEVTSPHEAIISIFSNL